MTQVTHVPETTGGSTNSQQGRPEEYLTLNIYELLSCDLQMYILTFLCVPDLYSISLSCHHGSLLVLSPEADGYVWKSMASHLGLTQVDHEATRALNQYLEELRMKSNQNEEKREREKKEKTQFWKFFQWMTLDEHSMTTSEESDNESGIESAVEKDDSFSEEVASDDKECLSDGNLDVVKSEESIIDNECLATMWRASVFSNMIKWDPLTRTGDSNIKMHNNNKTISSEKNIKWDTIRANKKLKMGMIHCWEYTLDYHDNGPYNAYRIFVGIERSTYDFTSTASSKIIGYNSEGIGYNIGEHSIHRSHEYRVHNRSILYEKKFKFSTGDTIAIELDLQNLNSSGTASMHLFKNNKYFHTIADIPTKNIEYYPAISVIGNHRVSIRMKPPSMLELPARVTNKK